MKKIKCAPIAIICLIILISLTAIYLCGCKATDDTNSTEPIGYALIYHPDGDERVDFVAVRYADLTRSRLEIILEDGSFIITQYATLYYYPKS